MYVYPTCFLLPPLPIPCYIRLYHRPSILLIHPPIPPIPYHINQSYHKLSIPLIPPIPCYINHQTTNCPSHLPSIPCHVKSTQTMTTVLASQMFERFVEERLADPDHPQIKVKLLGHIHCDTVTYECVYIWGRMEDRRVYVAAHAIPNHDTSFSSLTTLRRRVHRRQAEPLAHTPHTHPIPTGNPMSPLARPHFRAPQRGGLRNPYNPPTVLRRVHRRQAEPEQDAAQEGGHGLFGRRHRRGHRDVQPPAALQLVSA